MTIILGSQDVTIVTSLIVSNVRGHQMELHIYYTQTIKLISKYQWVVIATRTTMTGACTMLTDQRGPVDSTEATYITCSIPTKSQGAICRGNKTWTTISLNSQIIIITSLVAQLSYIQLGTKLTAQKSKFSRARHKYKVSTKQPTSTDTVDSQTSPALYVFLNSAL